ncbi:MAG: ATP-binding cassette domain-containing protein [Streptosporangiaceae bacterium]|jgi:oleandomycin transport system ATP-binding protein
MTTPAIEVVGLTKSFGTSRVLDGVGFEAAEGTVLGLLGPNGAGKTTAVRILCTLLRPDAGHARVLGVDVVAEPQRVRSMIGLTGQYAAVDDMLSARENLYMIGRLLGLGRGAARRRAGDLLAAFGLEESAAKTVRTYSGGMRRRLDLAASLTGEPRVLFLDEPTTGLDVASRGQLWDLIDRLAAGGTTVLLTTQYLAEADRLASRVVVIDHGHVLAEGTPAELKERSGGQVIEVRPASHADIAAVTRVLSGVAGLPATAGRDTVTVRAADPALLGVAVSRLEAEDIAVSQIGLRLPSLDEAFLRITAGPASTAGSAR